MPFCAQLSTLMACSAITGITMGFLDTGGNVWCLDLWGRHSAPFMQGLHFCFALGALVAPLVAEPFLSPSGLVGTLQHVQPLHPGNSSLPVDNFGHIPSIGIHHGIAVNRPLPHTFVLGATPGFFERDRPRRRRRNAKQTTPLPRLSELNNATERGTDVSVQPRIQQLLSNTVPSTSTSSSTAGIPSAVRAPPPTTTSSAPTSSWTVSMQPRVLETLPPTTLSSVSASSSTASPATSTASTSPEPTLVSNTWNSSSAGEASGNSTDVVQSRMDNDNTTVSSTSASADVTTAAKKPTKPLYAEGAAAKNKWDRESQKPSQPQSVPASKPNAAVTGNSSISANATANGNVSTTASSVTSLSSVPPSTTAPSSSSVSSSGVLLSTATPSLSSVSSSVDSLLTKVSSTSPASSSVIHSSTTVSSSIAVKPSVTDPSKLSRVSPVSSTSPSVPSTQTPQPLPGTVATAAATVFMDVGPYGNFTVPSTTALLTTLNIDATTQSDHEKKTPLPTHLPSTSRELATTTAGDVARPYSPLLSSTTTVPRTSSVPARASEETPTVTASPTTTVTDAATTTTRRSSETLASTQPDIPKAHHEVQTAPSTSGRKPSVATTITAATAAITTLPPLETAVVTPSNHPDSASNDVPSNATEADGSALDPDGSLQKVSETGSTEPPGLTSWLLDKFKQNRLGKLEFVYAILGAYLFVVSAVFLAFLCTNPRETRSRQEEDAKVQGPSSKWSLVVLTSLFFFLYMGMEAAVGELLRIYAAPQTPGAPLPRGYLLTYVFWGSFAAARGIAVVAAIKVSCRTMLLGDLGVCFLASVLLVVGADRMDALLWAGVGVLGVGMASVLPTSLAWLERHVRVTNRVASFVLLGAAAGEMVLPFLASRLVDREPAVVVYVNVTVVTLCCLNFGALWLAAARRGEKYAAAEPDRSMYQLANLDDADESADFTLMRPLCANGDDGHALLMAGKPRARFLRGPDVTTS
uniref:Putative mucin-5ac n=1 Tax=Ixodes ricinus TaxID=34613 RepID=A0A6B0VH60_IXORI